jgi:hypothetical protein
VITVVIYRQSRVWNLTDANQSSRNRARRSVRGRGGRKSVYPIHCLIQTRSGRQDDRWLEGLGPPIFRCTATISKVARGSETCLGAVISEAIVRHYGRDELLRRLAHPFWFQSFGAVMGTDWHSSSITTSVIGALKRGLAPLENELGIHACDGRGKHSRQTPHELVTIGGRVGLDGIRLAKASRLIAKVDSAAVQDGFDLYLHGFIVSDDGQWVVVQQGMNGECRQARRYHWLSEGLKSFVEEPHAAIDGLGQGEIINLTDRRAAASRRMQLGVLQSLGPDGIACELPGMGARDQEPIQSPRTEQPLLPHLIMPAHHEVRPSDVFERRVGGNLAAGRRLRPDGLSRAPPHSQRGTADRAPCRRWRW